ncbi:hypothetical protein ACLB2K_031010 [Fragaria x ananassa]
MVEARLGVVEELDKAEIRKGLRVKVRLAHWISDPIKQAYPLITYDFGSLRATTNLTFKYERAFGFCKVCGMLKHGVEGCRGPSDMSEVVVLGSEPVTTIVLEAQLIQFRVPAANIDKGNMILAVPQLVDYEVGRPSEVTMLDNISRVKRIAEMGRIVFVRGIEVM